MHAHSHKLAGQTVYRRLSIFDLEKMNAKFDRLMVLNMDRMLLPVIVIGLLIAVPGSHCASRPIKIGAIFHAGDEEHMAAFRQAVYDAKFEHVAPAFVLEPIIKEVEVNTDSFKTAAAACELLEEGVAAIFGPSGSYTHGIVASIAAQFDVPHIDYVWRENYELPEPTEDEEDVKDPKAMTINVFPDSDMLAKAIADVIASMQWTSFAAVYENNESLARIKKALSIKRDMDSVIMIRRLPEGNDFRATMKEIKSLSISNVLVDVDQSKIGDLLYQAKQVQMLTEYSKIVVTYMDSSKLAVSKMLDNNTILNITGFNLRKSDEVEGVNLVESAVLYDAVLLFYNTLETLNARYKDSPEDLNLDPVPLSCEGEEKYTVGPNITSLMAEYEGEGKITGSLLFDENRRRQFKLQFVDLWKGEPKDYVHWDCDGVHFREELNDERTSMELSAIEKKTFIVSLREQAPYIMPVLDSATRGVLIDGKRYEGFCIDLIIEIGKELKFKHKFELVPDGQYGSYNPVTKQWNGLIRRLLDHQVDMAICDLTINVQRQQYVDFTSPFLNLGISILYRKPKAVDPNLFSFLSPLSTDVWIYTVTALLTLSIMVFVQARMAPGEWDNPHPCNPDPEELENKFDLKSSIWMAVGSLMQQGSDVLPSAPSIRMLTGMWWFFCIIWGNSYTANLAAFLTAVKQENDIKNVEDLAKQSTVKYGAVDGGATLGFFRDSNSTLYHNIYSKMMDERPSVFTKTNDEGVERVLAGYNYAFFMESTSIEYKMERECELTRIGGLIDNKGYGIALPKNSPHRKHINTAILKLQEKGVITTLKKKYWVDKGGGQCASSEEPASSGELAMTNVGGVFLVLLIGCSASFLVAVCEFLWNVRKIAVTERITPREALIAELKFAVNFWAETKPVKVAKSSRTSSTEDGAGRASTARSMVGSFLRLDILDKFDKDNNTNDRSDDRKIN